MVCAHTLTPEQRACIELSEGPLAISAGAGSGKTLVLTQRIVRALACERGRDERLLDIDDVLAITFTEKAAEELRFRLKEALRAEGMRDQALRVDEAWVSTIHGMCLRILKEHAFMLGLDPSFEVAEEASVRRMLDESIEEAFVVLRKEGKGADLDALFLEYPSRSFGKSACGSVQGMVKTLVGKAIASPDGIKSLKKVADPRSGALLIEEFFDLAKSAKDKVCFQRESARRNDWLQSVEAFLACETSVRSLPGLEGVLKCVDLCPCPAADFGSRAYKDDVKELQALHAGLVAEAEGLFASPFLGLLLRLAHAAYDGYVRRKREQGLLDNDDLLIRTYFAFRETPEVVQAYKDRFKLVLVDEFQDTDRVQLQIIEALSGVSGERLCVVGDRQQSIYRFRGADPSLFEQHIRRLKGVDPCRVIELKDNFRSHEDILGFVDSVFGRKGMGRAYMPLKAARVSKSIPFPDDVSRIRVLQAKRKNPPAMAREVEARCIAKYFGRLHAKGCNPGDMVLLLGRMTNADVYAQAIRREGLACVISGGSVFAHTLEALIVKRLLEVIANPRMTSALHDVLSSEMFGLDERDLWALSVRLDSFGRCVGRRPIDEGLRVAASCKKRFSSRVKQAAGVLEHACFASRGERVARIAMRCIIDSGWMARLEAQGAEGLAVAANVLKAIRAIEDIERNGARGAASVASAFAAYLDSAKEAPGTLPEQAGQSVRIMTVHASKGLEFPIVATAEMERISSRPAALQCETVEGTTFLSLKAGASSSLFKRVKRPSLDSSFDGDAPLSDFAPDSRSYADAVKALEFYASFHDAQERRRLLYVALTRAKESVFVSLLGNGPGRQAGRLSEDVRCALFGEDDFPDHDVIVELESDVKVSVDCVELDEAAEQVSEGDGFRSVCSERWVYPLVNFDQGKLPKRFVQSGRGVSFSADSDVWPVVGAEDSDAENHAFWTKLGESLDAEAEGGMYIAGAFRDAMKRSVGEYCRKGMTSDDARLSALDEKVLADIAKRRGLESRLLERLRSAHQGWVESEEAREIEESVRVETGVPICVPIPEATNPGRVVAYCEGSIDVLALHSEEPDGPCSAFAMLAEDTLCFEAEQADCRQRMLLSTAICSLALFSHGCESVAVAIAVPNRGFACVRYSFRKEEEAELKALVADVYARFVS